MPRPIPPRPFPFVNLLANLSGAGAGEWSVELGVSRRRVEHYKAQRCLSAAQADALATRAGFHPAEIWGDLWWQTAGQEAM